MDPISISLLILCLSSTSGSSSFPQNVSYQRTSTQNVDSVVASINAKIPYQSHYTAPSTPPSSRNKYVVSPGPQKPQRRIDYEGNDQQSSYHHQSQYDDEVQSPYRYSDPNGHEVEDDYSPSPQEYSPSPHDYSPSPSPHDNHGEENQQHESYLPVPETREVPYGGNFGVSGPGPGGFIGPAAFDPLPPPPPPLKGSVDYILIPLVLIGLAGPIFVVLYVILGAFESRLAPITRSLGGIQAYMPEMDSVMSSVARALDQDECLDYAACRLGSLCHSWGYGSHQSLKRTLDPLTPPSYKRTMRKLFDSAENPKGCSINKCLKYQ